MDKSDRDVILRCRKLLFENRLSELSELLGSLDSDKLGAARKLAADELGVWSALLIRIREQENVKKHVNAEESKPGS